MRLNALKYSPNQETKIAIGQEICKTYFDLPVKPKAFKIESVEPEGTFQAMSYPKFFVPVMDEIIKKHAKPKRPRNSRIYTTQAPKK